MVEVNNKDISAKIEAAADAMDGMRWNDRWQGLGAKDKG